MRATQDGGTTRRATAATTIWPPGKRGPMRATVFLVLLVPMLAGCLAGDGPAPVSEEPDLDIDVPPGARPVAVPEGKALVWDDVAPPFEHTFLLPEGATMVRLVADPGVEGTAGLAMWNEDTGRRRCNQQTVVGFGQALTGARSCSGLTAMDLPGTPWTVRATSLADALDVRVEFLAAAPDGPVALLDLSRLSKATYGLRPTEGYMAQSFDGTPLWVEVTLPAGDGPWPTVVAASPYNGQQGRLGQPTGRPAMWEYWTQDFAMRGYAAVNVDVRGFGLSGGCVEIWGENEQQDQAFIVDWIAKQDWSDGNVGFYGQSYVGTTPVEAAVRAPEALKAIIAVAPVINSYEDWHYGGVPNGESTGSPQAYQVYTDDPRQHVPPGSPTDIASILGYSVKGLCDPTILPLANDPRAVYTDFYAERDFKRGAGDVRAAVLYTQGFEDANVKSAMVPGWFNEIQAPKLGVFGHWMHQHPARMDAEVLFLGWLDQYVKGRPLGFEGLPAALVSVDGDTVRHADGWPLRDAAGVGFGIEGGHLVPIGAGTYTIDGSPAGGTTHTASVLLDQDLSLVAPVLHVEGTLAGDNLFLYASLTAVDAEGSRLLTYGMHNVAHGDDHATYTSGAVRPGVAFDLRFRPTEHLVPAGTELVLTIGTVGAPLGASTALTGPARLALDGETTVLRLPGAAPEDYLPMPLTGRP